MRMNDRYVLQAILEGSSDSQRDLAHKTELSLGAVNNSIKALKADGYIDENQKPTDKALKRKKNGKVQNAVILAAGLGLRLIPINHDLPKGLIKIDGEPLIERLIKQLQSADIKDITIVLGYMMERYEYLQDKYGVKFVFNNDYALKNNIFSLRCVEPILGNTYIVPCDLYFKENPFRSFELGSWYMAKREESNETDIRVLRSGEIEIIKEGEVGNSVVGLAFLSNTDATSAREKLIELTSDDSHCNEYWESIITSGKRMTIEARYAKAETVSQINTYEDLRQLAYDTEQLDNDATRTIQQVFGVTLHDVKDLAPMKKGFTNDSLCFSVNDQKYIMRLPGLGTENFIDRKKEAHVYEMLRGKGICTDLTYIDPAKGYKITPFIDNARCCDETNPEEIKRCMTITRKFHELKLALGEEPMNIFNIINYYIKLWNGKKSVFADFDETYKHCMAMQKFVDEHHHPYVLQQGDCNPDNFLLYPNNKGGEDTELIDWEYAADGDPLMDIAAFVTYRKNDREFVDMAIDAYFPEGCSTDDRLLIYCYTSLWGLYNSNWCEYKMMLGEEFGEFMMTCYYYAKTYYRVFEEEYKKVYGKEYNV